MSSVNRTIESLSASDSSESDLEATDLQIDCNSVYEVYVAASYVVTASGQKRSRSVTSSCSETIFASEKNRTLSLLYPSSTKKRNRKAIALRQGLTI